MQFFHSAYFLKIGKLRTLIHSYADKINLWYGLAVRAGQVAAVPVPAAAWLFGFGLIGLVGVARRRKTV